MPDAFVEKKEQNQLVPVNDVHILVTPEDITGDDILEMSNFFDGYVQQLSVSIKNTADLQVVTEIPFADLGIISEAVQGAEVVSRGATRLIPDFDNLPTEVKTGLKNGTYTVGESRQVNGNLRAVIVDESGTRVRDVTLKKVSTSPEIIEASRSITDQLQMRQIYAKLDAIQENQNFQIARDRARDIKGPFLDARYYILKAQGEDASQEEIKCNLEKASEKMLEAIRGVYLDIDASQKQLEKQTSRPIFRNNSQIRTHIAFITEDLQIVTKFVGLRMQILGYLGDRSGEQIVMNEYQQRMVKFFTQPIEGRGLTAAELIHMNYPYTDVNRNCWYNFSEELKPALEGIRAQNSDEIYVVALEKTEDGKE